MLRIFILFFLLTGRLLAQQYEWVAPIEGAGASLAFEVAVDDSGNVYASGSFQGANDFDPGPGVLTLPNQGGPDIFITKLNPNGQLVWAKTLAGPAAEFCEDMTLDAAGNLTLVGTFADSLDIDPGPGTNFLHSKGLNDGFVVTLNPAGNLVRGLGFGNANDDAISHVWVQPGGEVTILGTFRDSLDLDPGPGTQVIYSSFFSDGFLLRLNATGNLVWGWGLGNENQRLYSPRAGALDASGGLYLAGVYLGDPDVDPGPGTFNLPWQGGSRMVMQKIDSLGHFEWAKVFLTGQATPTDLELDPWGNVLICGETLEDLDVDPGPGVTLLPNGGAEDVFLARFDPGGNLLWGRKVGEDFTQTPSALAIDAHGNSYLTGQYRDTTDFDPGPNAFVLTNSLNPSYRNDMFAMKLDSAGLFHWAMDLEVRELAAGFDIETDQQERVYIAGYWRDTADFDPGPAALLHYSTAASADPFVLKLSQCRTYATLSPHTCDSFAAPGGGATWTSSGTYLDTLLNGQGCDSVLTIFLTVDSPETAIQALSDSLLSLATGDSWQWLDCNNAFSAIVGATDSVFVPSVSGNYAVEVTQGNCRDTSTCIPIALVSSRAPAGKVHLYPNPSTGRIHLTWPPQTSAIRIKLFDLQGRCLWQSSTTEAGAVLDLPEAPGCYWVELGLEERTERFRALRL